MVSRLTEQAINSPREQQFLVDSNVWLSVLDQEADFAFTLRDHPSKDEEKRRRWEYIKYFALLAKQNKPRPRIVFPAVLLSEIINAYMHSYCFPKFIDSNRKKKIRDPEKGYSFKKHYRQTEQFISDFNLLRDTILEYAKYYAEIPDNFGAEYHVKQLMDYSEQELDFNDNYYRTLARKNNYSIITNDRDFGLVDVRVLTLNPRLLYKK